MNIRLDGRSALVTGGTKGIGRAIVLRLADMGASVTTCYRDDDEAAEEMLRELKLKQTGADHRVLRADLTRPEEVARLVAGSQERTPALDVLVHSAGAISHIPVEKLALEEWHRIVDTNLTAAYLLTQQALPLLGPGSSVIFVGSKVATVGVPERSHYTAAKAALAGFARSLCKELGPRGIRVNVIAPGVTESPATERLAPAQRSRYESMAALRRLGHPEEVSAAVAFLASDYASYITGETLNVDGGM
jgi:3-oxoacyl-[acyl-carrier protein] reductase